MSSQFILIILCSLFISIIIKFYCKPIYLQLNVDSYSSVSLDQCRTDGAMLAFTVMDHDVLTSNDFAGEAYLSLGSIPGVNSACNADNFHGLKQLELALMHQKNKS